MEQVLEGDRKLGKREPSASLLFYTLCFRIISDLQKSGRDSVANLSPSSPVSPIVLSHITVFHLSQLGNHR